MSASFPDVLGALRQFDGFRLAAPGGTAPTGCDAPDLPALLVRQIRRLQARSVRAPVFTPAGTRAMIERAERLAAFSSLRGVGSIGLEPSRRVLVTAHGPSLRACLDELRRGRDRLTVVAPFRTAIELAREDILPDVVVLADRDEEQYGWSLQAWNDLSPAARAALARTTTLAVELLAPPTLYESFQDVRFFDRGLDVLPPSSALPFWGYALLSAVCLPLLRGARRVAIAGVDLTAAVGAPRQRWDGSLGRLDRRVADLLKLLELVAASGCELIDVGRSSVVKQGCRHQSLTDYLEAPAERMSPMPEEPDGTPASQAVRRLLGGLAGHLDSQKEVVGELRLTAVNAVALASGSNRLAADAHPASPALEELMAEVESVWPSDPRYRAAADLLQPFYLQNLWRLRERKSWPFAADPESVRRRALLVFRELEALTTEHQRMLPELAERLERGRGEAGGATPPREASLPPASGARGTFTDVGIIGSGAKAREAARWLRERHGLEPSCVLPWAPEAGGSRGLDRGALEGPQLWLAAPDAGLEALSEALTGVGLRRYQDFLEFRPVAPAPRPDVDRVLADIDRLNVTELDDLAQRVRERINQRSSLRADYWVTIYRRFVHELRDRYGFSPRGRSILELGTGSGLGPLILLNLAGARTACTCDFQSLVKPYAAPYRDLLWHLLAEPALLGADPPPPVETLIRDFQDLVRVDGDAVAFNRSRLHAHSGSLLALPYRDASFDLVYSNAVLEHVTDPEAAAREMWRVLRPGALAAHRIDLSDHADADDPHRFLRYSDELWWWLNRHQVYTENRLRRSDFLAVFAKTGFDLLDEWPARVWPVTAETLAALHPRFHQYDLDDLSVVSMMVVLRKR